MNWRRVTSKAQSAEAQGLKGEELGGVLEGEGNHPLLPTRGSWALASGERYKLPSEVQSKALAAESFSCILEAPRLLLELSFRYKRNWGGSHHPHGALPKN